MLGELLANWDKVNTLETALEKFQIVYYTVSDCGYRCTPTV